MAPPRAHAAGDSQEKTGSVDTAGCKITGSSVPTTPESGNAFRKRNGCSPNSVAEQSEGTELEAVVGERSAAVDNSGDGRETSAPAIVDDEDEGDKHSSLNQGGLSSLPEVARSRSPDRVETAQQEKSVCPRSDVVEAGERGTSSLPQRRSLQSDSGAPATIGKKNKTGDHNGAHETAALRHLQRRFSPGHANFRIQRVRNVLHDKIM